MKTYAIDFHETSKTFGRITIHQNKREVSSLSNGLIAFHDDQDLLEWPGLSSSQMVAVYNSHYPKAEIKKFSDRATACKRIFSLAQAKAESNQPEKEKNLAENVKKEPKEKKPKKEKAESESHGRKGKFTGKHLFPSDDLTENPRREGTQAHKSMSIIIKAPGVAFEDFIASGGKTSNLSWDIDHHRVIVR